MSTEYRKKWIVTPDRLPMALRKCPRCGGKSGFENSGRFRVNANGRSLDVWLIYRCKSCDATWNMAIYQRVDAASLDREEYKRFLDNDIRLAAQYGSDPARFAANRVEMSAVSGDYRVQVIDTLVPCGEAGWSEVQIRLPDCLKLRVDALFAGQMEISRVKARRLCEMGLIRGQEGNVQAKDRVRDGQIFCYQSQAVCESEPSGDMVIPGNSPAEERCRLYFKQT